MKEVEREIIERSQRKDRRAFEEIIKTYKQLVANMCLKYMRNEEEALDMSQEVFCEAFRALPGFKFKSRLSTWLYRMTVNLCSNKLRFLKRRKFYLTDSIDEDEEQTIQIEDKRELQDVTLERKEMHSMVRGSLMSFPEDERELILMRFSQGLKYEEISEILKIPLGSVKSKLNRAKEKMKKIIKKRIGEKK